MKRYDVDVLSQSTGLPVLAATLTVYVANVDSSMNGTVLATLYQNNDVSGPTVDNPAAQGTHFYAADGLYDFVATSGTRTRRLNQQELFDLAEMHDAIGPPVSYDLGTIDTNLPMMRIAAEWDWDGLDFSRIFTGFEIDISRTNIQDQPNPAISVLVDGDPCFQVLVPTYDIGGSRPPGIRIATSVAPDATVDWENVVGTAYLTLGDTKGLAFYWEAAIGDTMVMRATNVTNRLSIESSSAVVLIADSGHFEFETGRAGLIEIVGYDKATSIGTTIRFTNQGQAGDGVHPVAAVTDTHNTDIFRVEFVAGGVFTTLAWFDGFGRLHAPAISSTANTQGAPATALTGSIAESAPLVTWSIPAGAMGPNGQVEVEFFVLMIGTAGGKTVRVYFDGNLAATFTIAAATVTQRSSANIANRTASTQVCSGTGTVSGYGASTSALVTLAVNSALAKSITITGQLANADDTMTLESYRIRTTYGA